MSGLVTVSRGKIGATGVNAENGYIPADIRYSKVANPVLDCLYNNNLSRVGEVSFTRGGEAIILDRYGNWQFESDLDRTNHVIWSEDFTLTAGKWANTYSLLTSTTSGLTDPLGGSNAYTCLLASTTTIAQTAGNTAIEADSGITNMVSTLFYSVSFWIKVVSGTFTGARVTFGSTDHEMDWTPSGSWVQVTATLAVGGGTQIFGITPYGTSGSEFGLYGVQVSEGSVLGSYIVTTGAEVTVSAEGDGRRANENGYLIESASTNLITQSEDLSETGWAVSGAALSAYSSANPFGAINQNTLLTFSTSSTATVTKTATFTNGTSYSVSLFFKLISGNITTITAALGAGSAVNFATITSTWARVDVECVAGASNDLVLTIISPEKNGLLAIAGIQVEEGSLSSYMRTSNATFSRPVDILTVPYNLGRPDEPWTIFFKTHGVSDGLNKYIFNNGLTGSNAFSCYYSTDTLYLNIGGTISNFSSTKNNEVCLSYDGTTIKQYLNGTYVTSATNTDTVSTIGSILTIGSDGTNALDAQLSGLRIYDFQLTDKEIAYISGEY